VADNSNLFVGSDWVSLQVFLEENFDLLASVVDLLLCLKVLSLLQSIDKVVQESLLEVLVVVAVTSLISNMPVDVRLVFEIGQGLNTPQLGNGLRVNHREIKSKTVSSLLTGGILLDEVVNVLGDVVGGVEDFVDEGQHHKLDALNIRVILEHKDCSVHGTSHWGNKHVHEVDAKQFVGIYIALSHADGVKAGVSHVGALLGFSDLRGVFAVSVLHIKHCVVELGKSVANHVVSGGLTGLDVGCLHRDPILGNLSLKLIRVFHLLIIFFNEVSPFYRKKPAQKRGAPVSSQDLGAARAD